MLRFKNYLSEEVLPTGQVSDGSIDIEKTVVRGQVNATLTAVTAQPAVTPYIVMQKIQKALAYFHIILPKRAYLEGDRGVEAIEVRQFGHKMGMTNDGQFIKEIPGRYFLFISYRVTNPVGVAYTAVDPSLSSVGGMYKVTAKLVDEIELQSLMSAAEVSLAEDASCRQDMAKALAPKEPMHDIYNTKSDSAKTAAETSQRKSDKKLSASKLDEVSLGKLVRYKNKAGEGREKGLELADKKMKGKAKVNASAPKHPYMEETVEEGRMPASVIKHKQRIANMTPEEKAKKFAGKSEEQLKSMARRHGFGKDSNEYSKHVTVKEEQIDELSKDTLKSYIKKAGKSKVAHSQSLDNLSSVTHEFNSATEREIKKGRSHVKKMKNRRIGIERASDRLDEKAPPGAKFERMVKHIKKGYSKDGLTAKEKSIAYATAWKAKNKESE